VHTCTVTLADAVWEGQPVPGDQHAASAERRKVARVAAAEVWLPQVLATFLTQPLRKCPRPRITSKWP
jgi:hypothetical protein